MPNVRNDELGSNTDRSAQVNAFELELATSIPRVFTMNENNLPMLNSTDQVGVKKFAAKVKKHLKLEKKDELLAKIHEFKRKPIVDLRIIEEVNETEESVKR